MRRGPRTSLSSSISISAACWRRPSFSYASESAAAARAGVALFSGNVGFVLGAVLKYAHSLLFHLYQHRWWGEVPVRKVFPEPPRPTWGFASAHYHAWHHAHPESPIFTYAEHWAGFDRSLERLDPWLERLSSDAREARRRSS